MKILLLTCLLASALAAPAEKNKRNVLPGDPRYDAQHDHHHHHHHEDHDHQQNEIEIAKALGGYVGTYDSTLTEYGIPGFQPGTPISSNNFVNTNFDAGKTNINAYEVEIGGAQNAKQIESVTESSLSLPKVKSVTVVQSQGISQADDLAQSGNFGISKGQANNLDNTVISTTAASVETSSVPSAYTEEVTKAFSGDGISTVGNFESPFQSEISSSFGPSFDSGLSTSLEDPAFYSLPSTATPFSAADVSTFEQAGFNPFGSSFGLSSDASKGSSVSADAGKVIAESAPKKINISTETVTRGFGSANDGLATPFQPQFSSSFGADFNSRLGSSFRSSSPYSSSLGATPSSAADVSTFEQAGFNPFGSSFGLSSDASKGSSVSADAGKVIAESAPKKINISTETVTRGFGSANDGLATPFQPQFSSSFGADFNSRLGSSFRSSSPYSSSLGATPSSAADVSTFEQAGFNPFGSSFGLSSDASKGSSVSADAGKVIAESAPKKINISTETVTRGFGSANDGLATPFQPQFSSSFGADFNSRLGSSFRSSSPYSSSLGATPSSAADVSTFEQAGFNPFGSSFGLSSDASKGSSVSADAGKVIAESAPKKINISTETVTRGFGSANDGLATPFQPQFSSSFGADFNSRLGSSFRSSSPYSSSLGATPSSAADVSTFEQAGFNPFGSSFGLSSDASKGSSVSADAGKVIAESAPKKINISTETVTRGFGSANDGLATPFQPQFSSSFGADFNSRLGSSFRSSSPYSSSLGATPFSTTSFNTFKQSGYNPSFGSSLSSNINNESATLTSNAKAESKAQSKAASSDYSKKIIESTSTNIETAAKTFPASFGSSVDSFTAPVKSKSDSFFRSSTNTRLSPSFGSTSDFGTFTQGSYKPSFGSSFSFSSEANKGSTKSTSATNIASKSGSSKAYPDASKTTVKSAANAAKSFTDTISTKSGLDIDNLSPPLETNYGSSLGSTFGSGFSSIEGPSVYSTSFGASPSDTLGFNRFQQVQYNPSLKQTYTYTPSIEGYNNNFGIYNNNYGRVNGYQDADYRTYPTGVRSYSGFEQSLKDTTLNGNAQVSYPQSYSSDLTGGVRYVAPQSFQYQSVFPTPQSVTPSPFPTTVSVTEAPTQFKFDSAQSYLSPSIEQAVQPNFYVSPNQQELFKNYQSTVFSVEPTPATFPRLSQPEVKISESSLSGINQQTDAEGGYIY
ncbi:nuclear envelope pore membrane protein POM 121-like [Neodiprion virginianus]|uniref:nuclear envelope pore membrane protein POM 121-like n=1 Tax=Neodiprion virginianus TaxID=2961670 RepID=UPI001EE697F9|nr:nuclear envelope pore membrane protein POM 121-like [Neodiprion virginianus]